MKLDDLPPPGEYWKPPPAKEKGDDDFDAVFAAVGKALSRWETLEQTFAFLFQRFVDGSDAAKRAYGSIMSNNGRRSALFAAAESYFIMDRPARDELRKRLPRVLEHFRQAATRRNEIAHGVVATLKTDGKDRGRFLIAPEYNSNKRDAIIDAAKAAVDPMSVFGDYRYTSSDLSDFAGRVTGFRDAVQEYAMHGWDWDLRFRMGRRE